MATTKRVRNYVFTINNPVEQHIGNLVMLEQDGIANFITFQLEKGEKGTPHFQGYIELKEGMTISALQKHMGEHKFSFLDIRRGTQEQAINYANKKESRIKGPWTFGNRKEQGKRNDLIDIKEMITENKKIEEIAENYPGQFIRYSRGIKELKSALTKDRKGWKPELIIIKGEPGIGKSKYIFDKHDDVYVKDPNHQWWDGYDGQEAVVINEFKGQFPITFMNNLIDYYPWSVQIKGSMAKFTSKYVYITTNNKPSDWWNGDMSSFWRRVDKYIDLDKKDE